MFKYFTRAFSHAQRFRSLRIDDFELEKRYWKTIGTSSPCLESLEIGRDSEYSLNSLWDFYIPSRWATVHSLRSTFVGATQLQPSFSALRTLRLTHRALRWSSPLFASNLVNLHVEIDRKFHREQHPKFTFAGLFRALSKMPHLQSLVLIYALPLLAGTRSQRDSKAHLSSLQSLVIIDRPVLASAFLSKVIIHPSTRLLVNCETTAPLTEFMTSEDCCAIIPFISRQVASGAGSTAGPIRSPEIEVAWHDLEYTYSRQKEQFIHVKGYRTDFDDCVSSMLNHSVEPSIALSFLTWLDEEPSAPHRIFGEIYRSLARHLDQVTLLALSINFKGRKIGDFEERFELLRVLEYTPNVRSLYLHSDAILPVIGILARNNFGLPKKRYPKHAIVRPIWTQAASVITRRALLHGRGPSLFLPHLNRLVLAGGNLDEVLLPERWRLDDVLLRTLAARRALLPPGETFHLSLALTAASQLAVKKLLEVVPEVEWVEPISGNDWEDGITDSGESEEKIIHEI